MGAPRLSPLPAHVWTEVPVCDASLDPTHTLWVTEAEAGVVRLESGPSVSDAASVSPEDDFRQGGPCVVGAGLTVWIPASPPGVVRVVANQPQDGSVVVADVDLSRLRHYETTVAVGACRLHGGEATTEDDTDDTLVQLLLVDHNGLVLQILLTDELQPVATHASGVLQDVPHRLRQQLQAPQGDDPEPTRALTVLRRALRTCQVGVLDARRIVLALNPVLVTLVLPAGHTLQSDLVQRTRNHHHHPSTPPQQDTEGELSHTWSLQGTRHRQASHRRSILSFSIMDAVSGVLGVSHHVLDLPPCLAIATPHAASSSHCTPVVSLHSTGAIYLWGLPNRSDALLPRSVVTLLPPHAWNQPTCPLPNAEEWTSDQPLFPLKCWTMPDDKTQPPHAKQRNRSSNTLAIGVALQTTSSVETKMAIFTHVLDDQGAGSPDDQGTADGVALVAPGVLLDWELVPGTDRQWLAIFADQQGGILYCIYNRETASNESGFLASRRNARVVASEPVTLPRDFFLQPFSGPWGQQGTAMVTATDSVADAIHAVDQQNLQRLFRQTQVPSEAWIRQALRECVPGYHAYVQQTQGQETYSMGVAGKECSLELETLLAIQELRHRQIQSKRFAVTPARSKPPPYTHAMTLTGGPLSLYEQLTPRVEPAPVDPANVSDDDGEDNLEQQVMEHQQRWNMLFAEICKVQAFEQRPCQLQTTPNGELVLLRPAMASVIRGTSTWNIQDPLTDLDEYAMQVLRSLEVDPGSRQMLWDHEQLLWNLVAGGKFALGNALDQEEVVEDIVKASLAQLRVRVSLPAEVEGVIRRFRQLPPVDRVLALQNMTYLLRRNHLPGLNLLASAAEGERDVVFDSDMPAISKQVSLAAVQFATICFNSLRRVSLGRMLLLLQGSSADEQATCLRVYIHMVGLLWVSCQRLPISTGHTRSLVDTAASEASPSRKRGSKLTGKRASISVLEALLKRLWKGQGTSQSAADDVIHLSKLVAACCSQASSQTVDELPELEIIEQDAQTSPKLALRLLAPFVRYVTSYDSPTVMLARRELLAECLLQESRRMHGDLALAMVQQAQLLLPFDATDYSSSRRRLDVLCQNLVSNPVLGEQLVDYVDTAIALLNSGHPNGDENEYSELLAALFTARFNAAIVVHRWDDAVMACYQMHRRSRRQHLERLVTAMVESGALERLIEMSVSPNVVSEQAHLEAYAESIDLASIATDTLSRCGSRDTYLLRATQEGAFTDYMGALFVFFIRQGHWMRAAEVQNRIYENARDALEVEPPNLDFRTRQRREELILNDLVSSAIACREAIEQITSKDERFIVFYPHGNLSEASKMNSTPEKVRPRSDLTESPNESRQPVRLFEKDINLRAHLAMHLSTVYFDASNTVGGNAASDWAKSTLMSGIRDLSVVVATIDELLRLGYLYEGLLLAVAAQENLSSEPTSSHDMLEDILIEGVIHHHLFPLAHSDSYTPSRPTLQQLNQALDLFGNTSLPPLLQIGDHSKMAAAGARSDIRTAAHGLMRHIILTFSSARTPLARKLAALYLDWNPQAPLPEWLERFMLFGSDMSESHGMFASYASNDETGYPGDPSTLLSWYTNLGLYEQACRVVIAVLAGPDPLSRRRGAPSRMVQKGKTDYVPMEKIDLLYNLMDVCIRKRAFDGDRLANIKSSQHQLESALVEYLGLLKISSEGMQSALAMQT